MKVLQVTTHINTGGIASYILNLSDSLLSKGIEVAVASSGGSLENEFRMRDIPHERLNIDTKFEFAPKVIISSLRLARIIKDRKIDIVHAHTRVSQVASLIAARLTGVRYVTTCHGYFKLRSRKIFDTWGDGVIAISAAVERHLEDDLGVDKARVKLIHNGVDIDRFASYPESSEDAKKSLGLKPGPVIGTIGRLSPVKGQRYLVRAMADILGRHSDAQCLIAGDGDEKSQLENLVRDLKISDSVRFAASAPDTAKFLAAIDVFVFPSVKEGLGIALLEAMASGKACVASDIGGISDIIRNPSCGILVPVGDVKAIAGSVLKLLDDKGLRQDMGANARQITRERFSLDAMGDKVIQFYLETLNEK